MNRQELENVIKNKVVRGQFTKATWQSVKDVKGDEYRKVSKGVVRFVRYGSIKGAVVKGQQNPNEKCLIPNALYENANTGNSLVQFATTNVKPKVTYYVNGSEVDKDTFEKGCPSRKSGPAPVFRVKAENVLELGN